MQDKHNLHLSIKFNLLQFDIKSFPRMLYELCYFLLIELNRCNIVLFKHIIQLNWTKKSDQFSSFLALSIFAAVFVFPFFVWYILWAKIEKLNDNESKDRFGSTYLEIKTQSKHALLYNVLYMLRRLLFAVITLLIPDNSFA